MQQSIDINSDVGESFGAYKIGNDDEVFKYISSANIACGVHAGDPSVMRYSILLAKKYGIGVGAHPGLPDLLGFGRRKMDITPKEAADYTTYQIGAIQAFAKAEDVPVTYVKFHGAFALYIVQRDEAIAKSVLEAMLKIDENLILLARPGTAMDQWVKSLGVKHAHEFSIDRGKLPNADPVSRKHPKAISTDPEEVADRVEKILKEGKMTAIDGTEIDVGPFASFCVHGDNPNAVAVLRAVRERLDAIGAKVKHFKEFFQQL